MAASLLFPLLVAAAPAVPVPPAIPAIPAPTGGVTGAPALESWATWRDQGRPRRARRVAALPSGRARLVVEELDSGRTFTAEIGAAALITHGGALTAAQLDAWGVVLDRAILPPSPTRAAQIVRVRSRVAEEDGLALAARLDGRAEVVPDLWVAQRRAAFDDPLLTAQWYVRRMGLERAWALSTGDPSIVVAIDDNGCDLSHPDLAAHMEPGLDTIDGDDDPSFVPGNGNEHGTACAGLVAAVGGNGVGIVGACPRCHLRCVRMLAPDDGPVPLSSDVEAFAFALDRGVAVSSNSWGFVEAMAAPGPLATAIRAFIAEARGGLGGVVVFAAGNDNRELMDDELTGVEGVITVSAVNNFDEPTSFTNRGRTVDLSAPTGSFTTDISGAGGGDPGDYTAHFGGTSAACPLVAGVFALLASAAPQAPARDLVAAMMGSLTPAPFAMPGPDGHDPDYGFGLANPEGALRALAVVWPADAGAASDDAGADGGAGAADAAGPGVGDGGAGDDAGAALAADAAGAGAAADEGCACGTARPEGTLALLALAALGLGVRRRAHAVHRGRPGL